METLPNGLQYQATYKKMGQGRAHPNQHRALPHCTRSQRASHEFTQRLPKSRRTFACTGVFADPRAGLSAACPVRFRHRRCDKGSHKQTDQRRFCRGLP